MNFHDILQIVLFLAALAALVVPLGNYMHQVYEGRVPVVGPWFARIERFLLRLCGDSGEETGWRRYAISLLIFNAIGLVIVYVLERIQGAAPLNPAGLPAVPHDLALNTAVSFVTNTNWQSYGGETTMSYLTQMLALGVQNFLSAATGMAVLIALARGLTRPTCATIGNFHSDVIRTTLYILLPLSLIFAIVLVGQGVVQSFEPYQTATTLEGAKSMIPLGPAASQISIKQLGTNGGGFFNTNSAHPFENPTPISNFLQVLAILAIPAALCHTYGRLTGSVRHGLALLVAMAVILIGALGICYYYESQTPPVYQQSTIDASVHGNFEGKEMRFGIAQSAIWASATTAASNGSVNSMHDSYTPLGGLVPMVLMQLGEVVFGGVGSGLYGMIAFVIIAVFVSGLMVGRTPEYLGKKIDPFEMKMASLVILIPSACILLGTAAAVLNAGALASLSNPGAHGFSEILYGFSSTSNNNGSAFAGLNTNTLFYNITFSFCMLAGRFGIILPILAVAGSMAAKKRVPPSQGTLPTDTPLFVLLLIFTLLIVGALTFFPAAVLGPVAEHLQLSSAR